MSCKTANTWSLKHNSKVLRGRDFKINNSVAKLKEWSKDFMEHTNGGPDVLHATGEGCGGGGQYEFNLQIIVYDKNDIIDSKNLAIQYVYCMLLCNKYSYFAIYCNIYNKLYSIVIFM